MASGGRRLGSKEEPAEGASGGQGLGSKEEPAEGASASGTGRARPSKFPYLDEFEDRVLRYRNSQEWKDRWEAQERWRQSVGRPIPESWTADEEAALIKRLFAGQNDRMPPDGIRAYTDIDDPDIRRIKCEKVLKCGHPCKDPKILQVNPCGMCRFVKEFKKDCGHTTYIFCGRSGPVLPCIQKCTAEHECGHTCDQPCHSGQPCLECEPCRSYRAATASSNVARASFSGGQGGTQERRRGDVRGFRSSRRGSRFDFG